MWFVSLFVDWQSFGGNFEVNFFSEDFLVHRGAYVFQKAISLAERMLVSLVIQLLGTKSHGMKTLLRDSLIPHGAEDSRGRHIHACR